MDNDSFESFINQSLVDSSAINTADGGDVGVENALLLQLLMSGVAPTATGTIDPSELSVGVAGDEGAFLAAGDASQNALLATALFSVLDAMPPIAVDNAMLVDSPPPTAAVTPTATATPAAQPKAAPAAKRKQTGPAQALGTAAARKRASGASGGPAAKKPATSAPPTAAAADCASPAATTEASGLASPGEENDDDNVDPKSLPPMKRRQLRNKISARNFRVRRKEQLTTLLSDSIAHKEEVDGLRAELAAARKDNAVMREEIRKLRLRLGAAAVPPAPAPATAVTAASGKVGQATPVPTRPAPQQKQQYQQKQPSAALPQTPGRPQPPTLTRPVPQQQQQPPSVQAQVQTPNQPQLPAAGAKAVPTMVSAASAARFNPHKDVGQAGPKKDGNWAAKNDRSGFIAVNTTTVPASHAERLESLAAETQNRRAVEALLNVGDGTHHPSPVAHDVLATFEKVAEYILSQIVLESSFALAHAGSHPAKVSC
ncbi:hypothetical protein GGI19_005379 [Coemansia pectinata]|uniref:BZIP domain-containing protein n=1 Tax=Coemansia pectinata TaxID=1052879 RepID=A0A9W8GPQ1_9FUNG|nr:hypothetical protein GGI19_005379 [Coemansia pectinata]